RPKSKKRKKEAEATVGGEVPIHLLAIGAGLLFAFSRTLWAYATLAEVYTLNSAFIAALTWLMIRWWRTGAMRTLYLAALLFGLGLGVHHVTMGLTLAGFAALVLAVAGRAFFQRREFLVAAAIAFLGLAVYAYLPAAASRNPDLNWGDPDSPSRILAHITGKQYRTYFGATAESVGTEMSELVWQLFREFAPPLLPVALFLAALGFWSLLRSRRPAFWMLLATAVSAGAWGLIYPIVHDKDAYALPIIFMLALAAACGVEELLAHIRSESARRAAGFATLALAAIALGWNFRIANRSDYTYARDYAENALRSVEPGGLLVTGEWQLLSPLLYLQTVEHARPDVTVLSVFFDDWYLDYVERRLSRVLVGSEAQHAWYHRTLTADATERNRASDELLLSILDQESQRRPVYLSFDIAVSPFERYADFVRRIVGKYDLVPTGLVFQLHRERGIHIPKDIPLELRGLVEYRARAETNDIIVTEIIPTYRSLLVMRGRYLALNRRLPEAIAAYEQAVALMPEDIAAAAELAQLRELAARR
ncbi:MAG TPA: DUF2723 domain-containing protein, partial [Thermoanaerobaculia bacterium]